MKKSNLLRVAFVGLMFLASLLAPNTVSSQSGDCNSCAYVSRDKV